MIDLERLARATIGLEKAVRMVLKDSYIMSERKSIIYRSVLDDVGAALNEFMQAQKPPKRAKERPTGPSSQ